MADIKIQDATTTTHAALTNKIPVYDGTPAATVITPGQIIDLALDNSLVAPPLGADDNYVTDAEKVKLSNLSGTNTGDQDLTALNAHLIDTSDPHNTTFDQLSGTLTKLPLNTSLAAQTLAAGEMAWNPDERTFDMGINGVTLQAGQEIVVHVRNSTASTIQNGTVCMATGTIGASGRITIAPMVGSNANNAMYLLGIATEDILAGADGFVTVFGKVRGVNTSAYVDGDVLYTSTTVAGGLTKTAPTSVLKQPIAFVVNAHSNGVLFVRIETLNHLAFQANGVIVTNGDGSQYLANDGTYKTVSSGTTDHGSLSGLADDDHTQYLNETRHDLLDHAGLTGIPSITGLLDETAHDLLDHTGLTGIPTVYTDEMAQDAVGAAIAAGTQSGITVTYDDANNKIDFTVTATGTGDVTGPAGSVDSNFALFNGTTGKIIKDGSVKASDFATASHNHTGVYQPAGTYSTDIHSNITALNAVSGTNTGDQDLSGYSLTSHNHAGVYEPADATILKDAAIGVTVQAYDADLTSWAAIAPSAKQDTLISGTNIKTINSTSILGSGNIVIEGGGADIPYQNDAPTNPSDGDLWVDKDAVATGSASLLVAETVVSGSAVTSVTFSGLDGNTDGGYTLVANMSNGTASAAGLMCFVNNDSEDTHYYRQLIYNSSASALTTVNGNTSTYMTIPANGQSQYDLRVTQDISGYVRFHATGSEKYSTTLTQRIVAGVSTFTVTNITSITIMANASSSIAVGSVFRLFKRK